MTTTDRYQQLLRLRSVFAEPDVERVQRIADQAPAAIRALGLEYDVILVLGAAGVATRDMGRAVDAVARTCARFEVRDAVGVAEFVAAAAAIGDLHGEHLLLLPTLFGYARQVDRA